MFRSRIARAAIACVFATGVTLWASAASASAGTDHSHHDNHGHSHNDRDRHHGDHEHDGNNGNEESTVYTETNAVAGNDVLAYHQNSDGTTTALGSFSTDGNGTGAGLGSQGSVTLDHDQRTLVAVSAGSNSVTAFSVNHDGTLSLIDSASSGGVDPISVTISGDSVYVLNAGDASHPANISGLSLQGDHLIPAPSNVLALNSIAASPEEISFSPDGHWLVVSEKGSDTVDVFPVDGDGNAGPPVTTTLTTGTGPFGFAFTPNGVLVLSEAGFGGLGSYTITSTGTLQKISEVSDTQLAACWVAISENGENAYTSNAHSGTTSFYSVASDGTLTLNNPAIATSPGAGNTDLALTGEDSQLDSVVGTQISTAAVASDGSLGTSSANITGLPTGTTGIAATN